MSSLARREFAQAGLRSVISRAPSAGTPIAPLRRVRQVPATPSTGEAVLEDSTAFGSDQLKALETGRRDDLENPAWVIPGVPECMPLTAGLHYEVAWAGLEDVVAQERSHVLRRL